MKRNNIDDIKIRQLLDNSIPQAPQNEWFVKKVMNRLPEKRCSTISIIEIIGYMVAILSILGIEIGIMCDITNTGAITLNNIVWLTALNITLIAIVASIFAPQFHNSLD